MEKSSKDRIAIAREVFQSGITRPYEFRIKQLKCLYKLLDDNKDKLIEAISIDTKRSKYEAILEINICLNTVKYNIYNLKDWMKRRKPSKPLPFTLDEVIFQNYKF